VLVIFKWKEINIFDLLSFVVSQIAIRKYSFGSKTYCQFKNLPHMLKQNSLKEKNILARLTTASILCKKKTTASILSSLVYFLSHFIMILLYIFGLFFRTHKYIAMPPVSSKVTFGNGADTAPSSYWFKVRVGCVPTAVSSL
jgi:hypothetical protein